MGHPRRAGVVGMLLAMASIAACTPTADPVATGRSATGAAESGQVADPSPGAVRFEPPDAARLPSLETVDPGIVRGTLDNGLRYLIRANDNPGARVVMRLVIDAGSGVQEAGQGGAAHFLEHMLFNGTEQFPENELIAVLRSFGAGFGADINAFTSFDETVYELTMPTSDPAVVSTGLDVLEQWLSAATIDQAQVVAERGVVLDEWRRSEQTADGRVFDEIQRFFLEGTPYAGRTPIGTEAEIRQMDAAPLRSFYDDWYRPDNAAVIIVGDIDAAAIERQLADRFAAASARGGAPERPTLIVDPAREPRARVVADPELSEGFAFVTLPAALDRSATNEASLQESILRELAFDVIGTRLANDALRGTAPFDEAHVDSSGFVRLLDAPEIFVSADGAQLEAATQAVLDEYERVRRHGFTAAEVARAVAERRRAARVEYDGRFSRQDAAYADAYVDHVLLGTTLPTADRWFEYVEEVLDRASPETVGFAFVDRFESTGAHIFVAAPGDEIVDVPDADVFVQQAASVRGRELAPRAAELATIDRLIDPPAPVQETSTVVLADGADVGFIAPIVLTFPNGVRVALNTTPIVEGAVLIEGRSPGGTAQLADTDVADAYAASFVVERSGVGDIDRVALDAFLADKDVELDASVDVFTEGIFGYSSTRDLETAFQLIHLGMTEPRVDEVALAQFLDDELPLAEDPAIDAAYMQFKTLLDARYDDPRYEVLGVADLNSIDAAAVERVYVDRFGDASDWSFSLSGDFDLDEARRLARTYLGTLPATGRSESVDYVEPAAPPGVITETARAGQGAQASVTFLFSGAGSEARRDDVAARLVAEVVTVRLTDTIREQLGESYSPFASLELTDGAQPIAELYLEVSTGPDLVDNVSSTVRSELDDLRRNGPTPAEFAAARSTVANQLQLFSNEQINDEVLRVLTDPAGNASFEEFLRQDALVDMISAADLRAYIAKWAPATSYIEVRVLPR